MSRMGIVLGPMNEHLDSIADIVRVSLWLYLHLNFRCNVMNLRHIIDMIVGWLTPHFIDFVFLWVRNSHPEHRVFDSFELRDVSHI